MHVNNVRKEYSPYEVREFLRDIGVSDDLANDNVTFEKLFDVFVEFPELEKHVHSKMDKPKHRPGTFELLVPKTRYYVNLNGLLSGNWVSAVGAAVTYVHEGWDKAAIVAVVGAILTSASHLSDKELLVVKAFASLTNGKPHSRTVGEDELRQELAKKDLDFPLGDTLDQLIDKNIIERKDSGKLSLIR